MKLLIASDIHGSEYYCRELLNFYNAQKPEKLILLGDILYHGPRNDLPRDYSPHRVAEMLNDISDCIICVRGNCDAEVDQMLLDFPIMTDSALLCLDLHHSLVTAYLTHGHMFLESNPPKLKPGSILLCGHTHVPVCREYDNFIYMNPGSVAIPKKASPHSCILYEDGVFRWHDLSGDVFLEYNV